MPIGRLCCFRVAIMGMQRNLFRILGIGMAMALGGAAAALAIECKPKTAGYFKTLETAALAGASSPIEASGVTRSLTGGLGDPQRGRSVMINPDKGNCIACHRIAALSSEPAHGDLGPTLNSIASRYTEAQLRQLIINARTFFPNTIMPGFHMTEGLERVPVAFAGQTILSAAEVEDVVAFLKTLR
jgi:sulfur-oxidizing protein SoxX